MAVSTASILIRYAQLAGAPSLVIAAWRLGLAALVLTPIGLISRRAELRALTRRQAGLALVSGAFLGLHFGAWISSLAYTTVASSVVLVSTSPLFVALIAAVALREEIGRPVKMGLGLTLAGAVTVGVADVCGGPGGCPSWGDLLWGPAILGDGLALVGATAGAIYYSAGRALRPTMSLTTYIFLTYGTAAVVLAGAVAAARLPVTGYAPAVYGLFALLALVPQLIGHSAFNWALKYLPATYVAVTTLGEPVGSVLLAALLLGEAPSGLKLAGSALILAGIAIASGRPSASQPTAQAHE
ncbi:MAG: DMT family transporter [Anaerolineales bacterium]|nr:DMT family transporter [Anaerolineales bacterium]